MHVAKGSCPFTRAFVAVVLACLCGVGVRGASEADLRAALDQLAGEWSGEVQVRAMDGFPLKSLAASRRAYWEREVLVVETSLQDGAALYTTTARHAIKLGRLESVVARLGQPEDRYVGEWAAGAIVWTNAEGNRRDARERVVGGVGERTLEVSSVEPIRALGLSGLVRVEGRFRGKGAVLPSAGGVAVAGESPAAVPDPAVGEARRAAVEAQERAQAAESRAAAADERLRLLAAEAAEAAGLRESIGKMSTEIAALREAVARAEAVSEAARREAAGAVDALEASRRQRLAESEERERLVARVGEAEAAVERAEGVRREWAETVQRLEREGEALRARAVELEGELAAARPVVPVVEPEPAGGAVGRQALIAEVQRMERRVLELESERNTVREQIQLAQRQLEETRRLRDDTLLRFQAVVTELNAMREEKERLARANLSLQAEVRSAQQGARASEVPMRTAAETVAPATTFDGKTADMIIAALQILGVTRGESEDKAILDGRLYRNGDLVEAQLGIVFVRIDGDALLFQDRRGREYRRRF